MSIIVLVSTPASAKAYFENNYSIRANEYFINFHSPISSCLSQKKRRRRRNCS